MEELEDSFDEQGRRISPVLPSTTKNFLIDTDGATRFNSRFTDMVRRTVEIEVFDDE